MIKKDLRNQRLKYTLIIMPVKTTKKTIEISDDEKFDSSDSSSVSSDSSLSDSDSDSDSDSEIKVSDTKPKGKVSKGSTKTPAKKTPAKKTETKKTEAKKAEVKKSKTEDEKEEEDETNPLVNLKATVELLEARHKEDGLTVKSLKVLVKDLEKLLNKGSKTKKTATYKAVKIPPKLKKYCGLEDDEMARKDVTSLVYKVFNEKGLKSGKGEYKADKETASLFGIKTGTVFKFGDVSKYLSELYKEE